MASSAEAHQEDLERGADRLLLAKKRVKRAPGPGCGCCKDLDQALVAHGVDSVRAAVTAIVEPAVLSLDGEARRCAKISSEINRAEAILEVIERLELKKKPGMIPAFRSTVDGYLGVREVDADAGEAGAADATPIEDTIPWPHEVDGAEVLDSIVELIHRHMNMPREAADATALWCAFAHALDCFWFNPRLALGSPVKRCGKTTLIEVLSHLVPRAKPTASVTAAVVFRLIDLYKPTYLIDETDAYLPSNEELRAVLNSGHTRTTAFVDRNVPDPDGGWMPQTFSTWCPQVVAGIGTIPGTLDDRSIKIRLQRKPRGVKLARFRADRVDGISDLGRMLARFVLDHQITLSEADIEPPEELHDRAADNWRPILAVASMVGGDWPARAEAAARALERVDADAEDLCVQVLGDIRDIFIAKHRPARAAILNHDVETARSLRLFTKEIMSALLAMAQRPWQECNRGRALNQRGLAQLLKVFGLATHKNVRRGTTTGKGFALDEFLEAYARYLPPLEPPDGVTGSQPAETKDFHGSRNGSHDGAQNGANGSQGGVPDSDAECAPSCDPFCDPTNPRQTAACDPVTHGADLEGAEKHTHEGDHNHNDRSLDGDPRGVASGNGHAADAPPPGTPCKWCGVPLDGALAEEFDGEWAHAEPCSKATAPQPEPPAPKPERKRRIKGADTTPAVDGLPK